MGDDWKRSHRIDWKRLPQIVGKEIDRQLQSQSCSPRFVDVVRTSVFTSMKADTLREGMRYRMVEDFHACNFQVLRLITEGEGEKCVDISLAVEMVSMAYVPNVFDIAGNLTFTLKSIAQFTSQFLSLPSPIVLLTQNMKQSSSVGTKTFYPPFRRLDWQGNESQFAPCVTAAIVTSLKQKPAREISMSFGSMIILTN